MQLHIQPKGAEFPQLVVHDANFKKNYKCFYYATKYSAGTYTQYCTKYEDIIYMKLKDYTE